MQSRDPYPEVDMHGFTNKEIRKKFVRKVYSLLAIELLILFGASAAGAFIPQIREWVHMNHWTSFGIIIGLFFASMIPYFAIVCYKSVRTSVPLNYIVLNIFVIMMSGAFVILTATYESYVFLCAFGTTFALVIFLTLISFLPCLDVTGWGLYLMGVSFIIGIFGIIAMFLYMFLHMKILFLIYAGLAAVLSCVYIIFITQMIIGGRKYELNPDEYMLGTIMLFTQIMNLFMLLMALFQH